MWRIRVYAGTPAFSQRLVLKDGGQAIANMDDDSKKLGYYSPDNGTLQLFSCDLRYRFICFLKRRRKPSENRLMKPS